MINENRKECSYKHEGGGTTTFVYENESVYIKRLFGFDCDIWSSGGPSRVNRLFSLNTSLGNVRWHNFKIVESFFIKDSVNMAFDLYEGKLRYESRWNFCVQTGVWSRKDSIKNTGEEDISIYRCLSKFAFSPGCYEVYSQDSRWSAENQGTWLPLKYGKLAYICRRSDC